MDDDDDKDNNYFLKAKNQKQNQLINLPNVFEDILTLQNTIRKNSIMSIKWQYFKSNQIPYSTESTLIEYIGINSKKKIFCRLAQFFGKHKVTIAFNILIKSLNKWIYIETNRKQEKKYTNRKRSVRMVQRIQRKEF